MPRLSHIVTVPRVAAAALALGAIILFAGCSGRTTGATAITKTSAALNYVGSCGAGERCSWYARYREVGTNTWTAVPSTPKGPVPGSAGLRDIPLREDVSGLTAGTRYEYQACGNAQPSYPFVCVGPDGAAGSTTTFTALPPDPDPDPVVGAAGDIACSPTSSSYNGGRGTAAACQQLATSDLLVGAGLAAVLPLGDEQYDNASLSEFRAAYGPAWGRVKSITRPAIGNHEYNTSAAAGYFDYFDGVGSGSGPAGDRTKGYYSYDVGSWHIVSLNSECSKVGGCRSGSAQEKWLKADLAAHPAGCTLAYWHRPLFNSSTTGSDTEMRPVWQDLYDAGADVILNGHAHDYERFAPQTPAGAADPARGIREFIVGTGGEDHHFIGSTVANSQTSDTNAFGVMRLTLHPSSYDWAFVPAAGSAYSDAGSGACH